MQHRHINGYLLAVCITLFPAPRLQFARSFLLACIASIHISLHLTADTRSCNYCFIIIIISKSRASDYTTKASDSIICRYLAYEVLDGLISRLLSSTLCTVVVNRQRGGSTAVSPVALVVQVCYNGASTIAPTVWGAGYVYLVYKQMIWILNLRDVHFASEWWMGRIGLNMAP